jgi:UDP-GlcNAc:undecaprenyl-phosphate GlcNAc-1-phosphate transferase
MDPTDLAVPFLVSLAVAAVLTPPVARLAEALGFVDQPSERSVAHRPGIPLLGGLAVATGFFTALGTGFVLDDLRVLPSHLAGFVTGAGVILAVGILDDRVGLGATAKFGGQFLAAFVAVGAGFKLGHITEPISATTFFLPTPVVWLVSVLWIVGITNAINLVDGLDGLATGVGAIICVTLTVILIQAGQVFGAVMGVALLGGLLGFLPYNFPPARIFLGDTGALFIGYSLSLLALEGYRQVTVITFVVPLLALAIPILDTAISILRRLRTGKPLFSADRLHMHHRLLARQGSPRAAVLQFYFLTACFSLIAVSFTDLHGYVAGLCLVFVGVLTLRMLSNLGVLTFNSPDELSVHRPAAGSEEDPS